MFAFLHISKKQQLMFEVDFITLSILTLYFLIKKSNFVENVCNFDLRFDIQ